MGIYTGISLGVLLLGILTGLLKYLVYYESNNLNTIGGTSIWCTIDVNEHKTCSFKNLCYLSSVNQFIFILSNESSISGIKDTNDLKNLELSSILYHNNLTMKISMVSNTDIIVNKPILKLKSSFIIHRFKWDNIMHVLHDDLMPLYFTYAQICAGNVNDCVARNKLVFADGGEMGPFYDLYKIFSKDEPLLLHKVNRDTLVCFDESRMGLSKNSIWFQYGFSKQQGPINDTKLTGQMVRQFTEFIREKLEVPSAFLTSDTALLFSRRISRKILNDKFLKQSMENVYSKSFPSHDKLRIFTVDLSTNDTKDILSFLINSKIVVGMHGSEMILSLFLKPGSLIVELFPYGINPDYVSPLKSVCSIQSLGLIYKPWKNLLENNTLPHPDAHPLLGGIRHLPEIEQRRIEAITSVPAVHCCHNPTYLYRMFQDTIVTEDFSETFHQALLKHKNFSIKDFNEKHDQILLSRWYYPSVTSSISCDYTKQNHSLLIQWQPPFNARDETVNYKVSVVGSGVMELDIITRKPMLSLQLSFQDKQLHFDVWVKSEVLGAESDDTHAACHILV